MWYRVPAILRHKMQRFHLYFDDTGTRQSDKAPDVLRKDGMDCFALGGLLIAEDQIGTLIQAHKNFTERWPLARLIHDGPPDGLADVA